MTLAETQVPSTAPQSGTNLEARLQSLKLDKPTEQARPPRRRRRWMLLLVVVALLAGGAKWITDKGMWQAWSGQMAIDPSVPQCEVLVVKHETAQELVLESTGFVVPRTKIHLNPSVPGKIVEFPIREGQAIKKGDLVVRIDDLQHRADLEQAEAGLELAQARLRELKAGTRPEEIAQARALVDQAKARAVLMDAEFQRAERLRDAISTAEYDKTKSARAESAAYLEQVQQALASSESGPRPAQIEVAQAEVDRAQAAVAKARHWLENTVVRSPINGIVLQKSGELGEFVRTESLVHSLCVIADLNDVEAEVDVQERDLSLVKVGQPCRLTAEAHGEREFVGHIARILPIASRQRGAMQLRVAIEHANNELMPDMNCRVQIMKQMAKSAEPKGFRLPKLAVAREGEKAFLFVLRKTAAHKVPVELGATSDESVEVTSGLSDGDRVLLARNGSTLHDGQAVNVSLDLLEAAMKASKHE